MLISLCIAKKQPVRSYKLGRSHSSRDDSTPTDRTLTEKDPSPRTEDSGSNVHEKHARHPGMIKRLSMKAIPNRRGSHSESPKPVGTISPNNSGSLTTKYKPNTGNTTESSKSSEKISHEAFTQPKSPKEKTDNEKEKDKPLNEKKKKERKEKKEKEKKEKKDLVKETELDELPEMEFTKGSKGRRRSSSPGSHRSSDSMTILPTASSLSTAGATMVGVNDLTSTAAAPDSIPPLKSFRQYSDPGIFSGLPVRWKSTFYTPPEKTRSGHKDAGKQPGGMKKKKSGQSVSDFLSPTEAKTGTESRSSNSGGALIRSRGSPRLPFSRSSTEQGRRSTNTTSPANSKQSSPRQAAPSLTSSSTPSIHQRNSGKKHQLRKQADKKEPFLPLDISKIIEARANGDVGHADSTRTIDSLRILPQSDYDEDEGAMLFSPELSSSSEEDNNRLRKARLSNDPPVLSPHRSSKSLDHITPPHKLKESEPVPAKRRTKSLTRRSQTTISRDQNKDFVESISDPAIIKDSGSAPNSDPIEHRVVGRITDSEVKRKIKKIEEKIAGTDSIADLKRGTSKRRNKTSSRRDTLSDRSDDKEADFRSPRKKHSSKRSTQSIRHTTPGNTPTLPRSTEHERQHITVPMFDGEWERVQATGSPVVAPRRSKKNIRKKTGSGSGESTVVELGTSPQVSPRTVGSTPKKGSTKTSPKSSPRVDSTNKGNRNKLSNESAKRALSIDSAFSPRRVPSDGKAMVHVEDGQSGFRNVGRTIYQSEDEISGMALPVLIDVIFELNGPMNRELRDPLLSRAFWRTYFLFLPARDLLRELITRLDTIMAHSEANPGLPFDRRVFIRIDEIVRCWIKFYYFDEDDFEFSLRLEKLDKMLLKVGARDKTKPSLIDCLLVS